MSLLPDRADVVVVGGGPAGAATAISLRRQGIDVLVLDRARFPRDKVCGDVLLPEARETLAALGLDLTALAARAYRCTGARYIGPGTGQIAGAFRDEHGTPRPWWMIRRRDLDAWLLGEARSAGAHVADGVAVNDVLRAPDGTVTGVHVKTHDGHQEIRARLVVGADGASSVVARAVGAFAREPEHTCLAVRAYATGVALPDPYLEVFTTPRTLPGCAWIVPVAEDEVNVGLGVIQTTANRLSCTPQALFAELRRDAPLLHERLRHAGDIALRGWTLPAATEPRRLAGPGWLLVGDAGAMIDPFTGHGIQNALAAGLVAGESIAAALRTGASASTDMTKALSRYDARCRAMLGAEVTAGARLQRVHANPLLVRAIAAAASRHAGLRATFVALIGHAAPRHALLSPAALARAATTFRIQGAAA